MGTRWRWFIYSIFLILSWSDYFVNCQSIATCGPSSLALTNNEVNRVSSVDNELNSLLALASANGFRSDILGPLLPAIQQLSTQQAGLTPQAVPISLERFQPEAQFTEFFNPNLILSAPKHPILPTEVVSTLSLTVISPSAASIYPQNLLPSPIPSPIRTSPTPTSPFGIVRPLVRNHKNKKVATCDSTPNTVTSDVNTITTSLINSPPDDVGSSSLSVQQAKALNFSPFNNELVLTPHQPLINIQPAVNCPKLLPQESILNPVPIINSRTPYTSCPSLQLLQSSCSQTFPKFSPALPQQQIVNYISTNCPAGSPQKQQQNINSQMPVECTTFENLRQVNNIKTKDFRPPILQPHQQVVNTKLTECSKEPVENWPLNSMITSSSAFLRQQQNGSPLTLVDCPKCETFKLVNNSSQNILKSNQPQQQIVNSQSNFPSSQTSRSFVNLIPATKVQQTLVDLKTTVDCPVQLIDNSIPLFCGSSSNSQQQLWNSKSTENWPLTSQQPFLNPIIIDNPALLPRENTVNCPKLFPQEPLVNQLTNIKSSLMPLQQSLLLQRTVNSPQVPLLNLQSCVKVPNVISSQQECANLPSIVQSQSVFPQPIPNLKEPEPCAITELQQPCTCPQRTVSSIEKTCNKLSNFMSSQQQCANLPSMVQSQSVFPQSIPNFKEPEPCAIRELQQPCTFPQKTVSSIEKTCNKLPNFMSSQQQFSNLPSMVQSQSVFQQSIPNLKEPEPCAIRELQQPCTCPQKTVNSIEKTCNKLPNFMSSQQQFSNLPSMVQSQSVFQQSIPNLKEPEPCVCTQLQQPCTFPQSTVSSIEKTCFKVPNFKSSQEQFANLPSMVQPQLDFPQPLTNSEVPRNCANTQQQQPYTFQTTSSSIEKTQVPLVDSQSSIKYPNYITSNLTSIVQSTKIFPQPLPNTQITETSFIPQYPQSAVNSLALTSTVKNLPQEYSINSLPSYNYPFSSGIPLECLSSNIAFITSYYNDPPLPLIPMGEPFINTCNILPTKKVVQEEVKSVNIQDTSSSIVLPEEKCGNVEVTNVVSLDTNIQQTQGFDTDSQSLSHVCKLLPNDLCNQLLTEEIKNNNNEPPLNVIDKVPSVNTPGPTITLIPELHIPTGSSLAHTVPLLPPPLPPIFIEDSRSRSKSWLPILLVALFNNCGCGGGNNYCSNRCQNFPVPYPIPVSVCCPIMNTGTCSKSCKNKNYNNNTNVNVIVLEGDDDYELEN